MSHDYRNISKLCEGPKGSRPLKAHLVDSKGELHQLEGKAIFIELDDERGIIIELSSIRPEDGICLRSTPNGQLDNHNFHPNAKGLLESDPIRSSRLSLMSGGANVFHINSQVSNVKILRNPSEGA